jgi:hypothetical protein
MDEHLTINGECTPTPPLKTPPILNGARSYLVEGEDVALLSGLKADLDFQFQ